MSFKYINFHRSKVGKKQFMKQELLSLIIELYLGVSELPHEFTFVFNDEL